jgi:hypothetical protein
MKEYYNGMKKCNMGKRGHNKGTENMTREGQRITKKGV